VRDALVVGAAVVLLPGDVTVAGALGALLVVVAEAAEAAPVDGAADPEAEADALGEAWALVAGADALVPGAVADEPLCEEQPARARAAPRVSTVAVVRVVPVIGSPCQGNRALRALPGPRLYDADHGRPVVIRAEDSGITAERSTRQGVQKSPQCASRVRAAGQGWRLLTTYAASL